MSDIGKVLAWGGGFVACVAAAPILLGFGVGGITAGSIAAGIQAGIGNVAAESAFAPQMLLEVPFVLLELL